MFPQEMSFPLGLNLKISGAENRYYIYLPEKSMISKDKIKYILIQIFRKCHQL
jgi:hypothetical protein